MLRKELRLLRLSVGGHFATRSQAPQRKLWPGVYAAAKAGMDYGDLIRRIIDATVTRYEHS
jgi:hypothetical protein